MISPEEFRKHAAECRRMASFTRDKANKERWTRLADRWVLAAELAEHQSSDQKRLPQQSLH